MISAQIGYLSKEKVSKLIEYKIRFGIYKTNKGTQILIVNDHLSEHEYLYYPKNDRLPYKITEGRKIVHGTKIFDSLNNTEIDYSGWNNRNQIMSYKEYSYDYDWAYKTYETIDIVFKKAHKKSEHHTSDYRIDLGYFRSSNGVEYQLGVTDNEWVAHNGYRCDYTIHGENLGDYSSGQMNLLPIYKHNTKHSIQNQWKIELYRRAVKRGLIDPATIKSIWIDENGVNHDEHIKGFSTKEKALGLN